MNVGAALRSAFVRALAPCGLAAMCRGAETPADAASMDPGLKEIRRTLLSEQPATDLPGWDTRLYLIEYPPGATAPAHLHPVVGVGYVLSGRFESAFEGEAPAVVEQGQAFVDKANAVHTLFRNPDAERPLRFVIAYTSRHGQPAIRNLEDHP
ncbi:MAG: cupin domain-containing protein [Polyangiaceae bacterium]|nr:cupin domain-containing protein [Polyangiaceae bacterium]